VAAAEREVGVAIANYNSGPLLARCLASLESSAGRLVLDPVVLDSRSTDDSLEQAARVCPRVRIYQTGPDPGFAVATNQAVFHAGGRFVLILNTDCFLQPGLERMVSIMRARADIAAVGPRLYNPDGTFQPSCGHVPEPRTVLRHYFPLTRLFPAHGGSNPYLLDPVTIQRPRTVGWIMGACMLVRRHAWELTEGLDEGFYLYSEEVDWCRRAADEGWKIVYFPPTGAVHIGGGSTRGEGALQRRLPYEHEKSLLRLMWKMRGTRATNSLRLVQATSVVLGLVAHGIAVGAGRETCAQWRKRLGVTRRILGLVLRYRPDGPEVRARNG
jgi:GT2 family glycosyltransferase